MSNSIYKIISNNFTLGQCKSPLSTIKTEVLRDEAVFCASRSNVTFLVVVELFNFPRSCLRQPLLMDSKESIVGLRLLFYDPSHICIYV